MIGAILGTIAIVAVTIVIGLLVDRKAPILPRPDPAARPVVATTYAAGEVAATAIRAHAAQLAKLRSGQRCAACRIAMAYEGDETVRYDERDLRVLRFRCPTCAGARSLYVEPLAER